MTIIEKEIERREALIKEKAVKQQKVAEMQAEIERLNVEIAETDETALYAEIDELKAYLPKEDTEEPADAATEDVLETPQMPFL